MNDIRFGIIGCGLMGREFASAVLRWPHLTHTRLRPKIVGVCDTDANARVWFDALNPKYSVSDYRELLSRDDIDAVYCAVPHHLHATIYCDIIRAGKHFMGEKPFGIDFAANQEILGALDEHPRVFARCSSEFPFYPACIQLMRWHREGRFGKILEVRSGIHHCSDLDPNKPINWKRVRRTNGEYGCIGDLAVHAQHVPFQLGFRPETVYAVLTKAVGQRTGPDGALVPCDTWDNACMLCEATDEIGDRFPMRIETKRMAPGATNRWFIEIDGMKASARFSTDDPNAFYYTDAWAREQAWCRLGIGNKPLFPTITGSIFEFGFSDAILQMWAAFLAELGGDQPEFGCFTPEWTRLSHKMNTAALESYKTGRAVCLQGGEKES